MRNGRLRAFQIIGLIWTLGVSLSADAGLFGLFGDSDKWKEEVQLGDGRIITIGRETIRERGGDEWAFNRGGTKPKEYRIRFAYIDEAGNIIEWRSTKVSPKTWPESPLIFEMESGQPTVYSLVAISNACEVYSKYVYRNGVWIEEPLQHQFEKRTANLVFGNMENMPSLLNLEEKSNRNSGGGYRRALKQVGPSHKFCG